MKEEASADIAAIKAEAAAGIQALREEEAVDIAALKQVIGDRPRPPDAAAGAGTVAEEPGAEVAATKAQAAEAMHAAKQDSSVDIAALKEVFTDEVPQTDEVAEEDLVAQRALREANADIAAIAARELGTATSISTENRTYSSSRLAGIRSATSAGIAALRGAANGIAATTGQAGLSFDGIAAGVATTGIAAGQVAGTAAGFAWEYATGLVGEAGSNSSDGFNSSASPGEVYGSNWNVSRVRRLLNSLFPNKPADVAEAEAVELAQERQAEAEAVGRAEGVVAAAASDLPRCCYTPSGSSAAYSTIQRDDKDLNAAWEKSLSGFEGFPDQLDYGIYFYGPDNEPRKFKKQQDNPFFSRKRNIVLHVHGWAREWTVRGRVNKQHRESYNWKRNEPRNGPDVDLRQAWADKGWDTAIFYWDHFSDEVITTHAEAKIWTSTSRVGMRYFTRSNGSQSVDAPTLSAAELLRDAIEGIMAECEPGVQIRLIGHSMGSQMVIRAAHLVAEHVEQGVVPASYLPSRITLMDPYFSPKTPEASSTALDPYWFGQEWLGDDVHLYSTTASLCLKYATNLAKNFGVLFEIYTSCPRLVEHPLIADPTPVHELVMRGHAAHVRFDPSFCPLWDVQARHDSAFCMYLWSMVYDDSATNSEVIGAPSAAMPDELLRKIRGSVWEQEPGAKPLGKACFRQVQPPKQRVDSATPWAHNGRLEGEEDLIQLSAQAPCYESIFAGICYSAGFVALFTCWLRIRHRARKAGDNVVPRGLEPLLSGD
eukprot:gnl/TRDRNA2_/TRDRNA2_166470_c4_seq1.p1 gnl/TRDRNA2_/TRDRNA2_166470_c4~~gnl/TRDRNA2_/TRDRNA2_166470_c4_seq1.p1  ORF type:complete len:873 (+),score=115.35 gnl/TRDRNA2_/TRDRNA2_166470_c4_seq1:317-2620(+)